MNILENKSLFIEQATSLVSGEENLVTNLSNLSALYKEYLPNTNWVGFYLVDNKNNNLVLGPFQGKVACTRIPFNKGVCGHCYTTAQTTYVEDVHKFPGHIACDSATNSELVIPIIQDSKVVALLDIDSIEFNRFTNDEVNAFSEVTKSIFNKTRSIMKRIYESPKLQQIDLLSESLLITASPGVGGDFGSGPIGAPHQEFFDEEETDEECN